MSGPTEADTQQFQKLQELLENWKKCASDRPLRVLVCGKGGTGKSTLVNKLLQVSTNEEWAKEGRTGRATTIDVNKFERKTERGIKVCIFDTPGFSDIDRTDEEISKVIKQKTEGKVDLLLYCISLDGACRFDRADSQAMSVFTQAFSKEIWNKAIIVLTFANEHAEKCASREEYDDVVSCITQSTQKVLAKLCKDIQVPVLTAGHTEPNIIYEAGEYEGSWDDRIFLEALQRVDPAVFPSLLETRYSLKDLMAALSRYVTGVVAGGIIGGIVGTATGAGPIVGAGVGSGVGAGLGTFIDRNTRVFIEQLLSVRENLDANFKVLTGEKPKQS